MATNTNRKRYEDPQVVDQYIDHKELQNCEVYLFNRYLHHGTAILDIGVGGGRTTSYLAKLARRYVGIDYSQPMIDACRNKFPGLEFYCADASDLRRFSDGEFDAAVFSFNGIDVINTDVGRTRCLTEIARTLKAGGILIFSSHNAKALAVAPSLSSARGMKILSRIARAVIASPGIAFRSVTSGSFFSGQGYASDPVDGGLILYMSTPETLTPQLESAGLSLLESVGSHYPAVTSRFLTPWIYYACQKR